MRRNQFQGEKSNLRKMLLRGKAREEPRRDLGLSNMKVTGDSAEEGEGWERKISGCLVGGGERRGNDC